MIKRKLNSLIAAILPLIALTGCSTATESAESAQIDSALSYTVEQEVTVSYDFSEFPQTTLEKTVAESSNIACAEFEYSREGKECTEYIFKTISSLKGIVEDEFVVWLEGSDEDGEPFSECQKYVLPLTEMDSVYIDYVVYDVYSHIVMPYDGTYVDISQADFECEDDDDYYNSDIKTTSVELDYLMAYAATIEDKSYEVLSLPIPIASTNISDIIAQSDCIVKAKISDEPFQITSIRGDHKCELIQCYKGSVEENFRTVLP